MSTNQLNVLVSLMIAIAFLVSESKNAQTYGYPNQKPWIARRRYCGQELADSLDIVCDGQYNYMRVIDSRDQEMEMADPFASDSPPFLSRARTREMLNGPFVDRRYRREWRSIHKECCINKCTISDLSMYCI